MAATTIYQPTVPFTRWASSYLRMLRACRYATPTSDPYIVISPYEPHAIISVAGVPQGAKVQDPVSNLVFLNPSGW